MITIDELVRMPEFGMSYLAGGSGGSRPISWAHTCDQPEPWLWVSAGDLMMTTGAGLPADPGTQVDWLERLADTRACGLMLGAKSGTPEVSERMRRRADELRFPVIDAAFELEFANVAHVVIESVLRTERARIVAARRLYDAWAQALHSRTGLPERLRVLGDMLGWRLAVVDQRSGRAIAGGSRTDSVSASGNAGATSVAVPGTSPARLLVTPDRRPVDDKPLLQHLAALIGVELEQRATERTERRHTGAALLGELLDGSLPLGALRAELVRRGLPEPLVMACFHPAPTEPARRLHHLVQLHDRYPLLLRRDRYLYAVLPDDPALAELLRRELGERTSAGLSDPLTAALGIPEAARQARLALRHAGPDHAGVARHAELSGLLPRSVTEARELVDRHLGPLAAHDRANGTELVHTLRTFLSRDGAWQATATDLGIHRQTLVYRLRTVRELTGLHPTSTVGTATFWLALEAANNIDSLNEKD